MLLLALSPAAAQNNPVPFVNQPLVPDAVAPGGPDFTLTVNGTGFVSGATVNWNGSPLTTTFVTQSQLTATVPASNIAGAGTASITATNPAPGGGTSNVAFFIVSNTAAALTFTGLTPISVPVAGNIITGDFNGDGKLDLAYVLADVWGPCYFGRGCDVVILLGNGDGSFQTPVTTTCCGELDHAGDLVAGDFNGDGKLDLALAGYWGRMHDGWVSILIGNGDGTFWDASQWNAGIYSTRIIAGDFNRDGRLDLATANQDPSESTDAGISVALGNGDGTFQGVGGYDTSENAYALAMGDFNGDGVLDLIHASKTFFYERRQLSFLQGNGDGTFQPPQQIPLDLAIGAPLIIADLNGDGKLDVIAAGSDGGVLVLLGNGDGTFQSPVEYAPGSGAAFATSDFNADGKLDLVLSNGGILLGNGDGTFQNPIDFPLIGGAGSVAATGDFNGDGKMDLAVTTGSGIAIFLQGQFPAASISPSSLTFTAQEIGTTSAPQTMTLTNTGSLDLTILSIVASGDFAPTNNCPVSPATLAANATCTISVTFTPTAVGTRSGSVIMTDNAPGSPPTVSLSGSGAAPVGTLSPPSLAFPSQPVGLNECCANSDP